MATKTLCLEGTSQSVIEEDIVLSGGLCMHTYAHTYPYRYTCIHTLCMLPIQKEEGQEHKTFTKYNVSVYLVKF